MPPRVGAIINVWGPPVAIRRELRERFQSELTPAEKAFFLREAGDAIYERGYRAGEDLFNYCWFLTLRERLRGMRPEPGQGYLRYVLVEGTRQIDDAIKLYRDRLEARKKIVPDSKGSAFLDALAER
jgi:hypothetical protein